VPIEEEEDKHCLRTGLYNTYCFSINNGSSNTPQYYFYTYIECLVVGLVTSLGKLILLFYFCIIYSTVLSKSQNMASNGCIITIYEFGVTKKENIVD
jgi:hypothetical protein